MVTTTTLYCQSRVPNCGPGGQNPEQFADSNTPTKPGNWLNKVCLSRNCFSDSGRPRPQL